MTYSSAEISLGVGTAGWPWGPGLPRDIGVFRRILDCFDRKGTFSVLDYGCGAGFLCRHIYDGFPPIRIEGVDASVRMIEQAKANCPWGLFYVGDADSPKLACYDVIVARDAFGAVADIPKTLRKLNAHLHPHGRFIIACRTPACAVHEQVMRTLTESAYRVSFEEFESEPTPEEHKRLLSALPGLHGPDREPSSDRAPRPESYWIISARKRSEPLDAPC